jgi:hypothetical protein
MLSGLILTADCESPSFMCFVKLIAWRDKDRSHLRDLIGVGLIDATWPARFPAPLGDRLQQLLDNPNG